MKINLGSGGFNLAGWVNVDSRAIIPEGSNPDVVADVLTVEYAENTIERVNAGHLMEHLERPDYLAARVFKWLRPGGIFSVTVPNFAAASAIHHGEMPPDPSFPASHLAFGLTNPPEQRHRQAFTLLTLGWLLERAGFIDVAHAACDTCPAQVPWQITMTGRKPSLPTLK